MDLLRQLSGCSMIAICEHVVSRAAHSHRGSRNPDLPTVPGFPGLSRKLCFCPGVLIIYVPPKSRPGDINVLTVYVRGGAYAIKYCPRGRYSLCNNILRYKVASPPYLLKQTPSLSKHAKGAGEDKTRMSSCIVLVICLSHLMCV